MDSAFGKDTAPQLGFDYREGTLRDILCTPTSNSPCASQGLRWIRTLMYQLRALHRRHCTRTVFAVRAVFNRGLLEACQRHLRSAGPEVSATYGQMLDELRRRTRAFLRHGTTSEEWISDAIADLTTKIAELAATDQRQRAASFQAYLKDALAEPGARRAHAMTRLEEPAQMHSFLPRGSLVDALHAAEATWHALWDVSGTPFDPTDLPTKINKPFEVYHIREVARSFPTSTSALDGILCRNLAVLPDSFLQCLSRLYWVSHFFADYSPAITMLAVKLIPKPNKVDEFRPIVLYPSLVRLHFRLLSCQVSRWERTFLRHLPFSNAQRRDALDTAFRSMSRMVLVDSAAARAGRQSWSHLDVSIDLTKCFEALRRAVLWHTGMQHNYPLSALRISLRSYSWERRLLGAYDIAGSPTRASLGICAGSAHATSELKLYLLPVVLAMQQQLERLPRPIFSSLSVYVDDISFSVSSDRDDTTLHHTVEVFRELSTALRAVHFTIAADKTEAVSSSEPLFRDFASMIAIVNKDNTCKKLGVDFAFCRPQTSRRFKVARGVQRDNHTKAREAARKWRLPVRALRDRTFGCRAKLCQRTFRSLPHRPVVRFGLVPSLLHGTDLAPISGLSLHQARLAVVRADRIYSPGMAVAPLLPLIGPTADPAFLAHSRAVLRIAREQWLLLPRCAEAASHTDRLRFDELLELLRLASLPQDGEHPYLDWLRASFQYFRILPRTPHTWVINSRVCEMRYCTKAELVTLLQDAWYQLLQESLTRDHQWPASIDLPALHKFYERSGPSDRRLLAQYLTGTLYTRSRAHKFDSDIDPACPSCGCPDDLAHRLHRCDVDDTPLAAPMTPFSVLPKRPGLLDWKFPLDHDPKFFRIHVCGPAVTVDRVYDMPSFDTDVLYTDGSCKLPFTPNCLSAGAAVALVEGQPLCGVYHACAVITPPNYPHSSFFGEVTGLTLALELSADRRAQGRAVDIHSDNAAVVTALSTLLTTGGLRWRAKWDGLWASTLDVNAAWDTVRVHKVKAHQTIGPTTPAELLPHLMGNLIADMVANKAVDYFLPRGLPSFATLRREATEPLKQVLRRLSAVRDRLPPVPRPSQFSKLARRLVVPHPASPHSLAWFGGGARCSECFRTRGEGGTLPEQGPPSRASGC
jgi:hypothetical protein